MGKVRDSNRVKADFTRLVVSAIWGSAFVAQRVVANQMNSLIFNGIRFLLAAVVLAPFLFAGERRELRIVKLELKSLAGILLVGSILFIGAAFQQLGLQSTTASNAGFITGLYVVLVPVILTVVWRVKLHYSLILAAIIAALGLFLLSTGGEFSLATGDGLEFLGAISWAFHVVLIGILVGYIPTLVIAVGQNLVCGVLSLIVGFVFSQGDPWVGVGQGWWAIIYTGVLSIGIGYTLQIFAQKKAPPADAAVILSMEAVFAAVCGWLFLDERLTLVQLSGCALIVTAMLLAQLSQAIRSSKSASSLISIE